MNQAQYLARRTAPRDPVRRRDRLRGRRRSPTSELLARARRVAAGADGARRRAGRPGRAVAAEPPVLRRGAVRRVARRRDRRPGARGTHRARGEAHPRGLRREGRRSPARRRRDALARSPRRSSSTAIVLARTTTRSCDAGDASRPIVRDRTGRPRADRVHRRHVRRPEGRDAHAREPQGEHRPDARHAGRVRSRRRRAVHPAAVPHLRTERRPQPRRSRSGRRSCCPSGSTRSASVDAMRGRPRDGDRRRAAGLRRVARWSRRRGRRVPNVRVAVSGAAPLPKEVLDGSRSASTSTIWEGYGLTETVAGAHDDRDRRRARSRTASDVRCPASRSGSSTRTATTSRKGDPGEIVVRGPNVFKGYWNRPDGDRRPRSSRTAGSGPVTSACSTTTATSSSSTARRT